MKRLLRVNILCTQEHRYSLCFTCVYWGSATSEFFKLECGIRQGGVLLPYLFAVDVDDIVLKLLLFERHICRHIFICGRYSLAGELS